MTTPTPTVAEPDDVIHHVTVADVEELYGTVLTTDQAAQIGDALALALANALNEVNGTPGEITDAHEAAYEARLRREGR
jgi:hypothetical protein